MTPAERERAAEQVHQAQVEPRMYRYAGCSGFVRRWFIVGSDHPYRSEREALEVAARMHERRGLP